VALALAHPQRAVLTSNSLDNLALRATTKETSARAHRTLTDQ
jgi:hypothetical protein